MVHRRAARARRLWRVAVGCSVLSVVASGCAGPDPSEREPADGATSAATAAAEVTASPATTAPTTPPATPPTGRRVLAERFGGELEAAWRVRRTVDGRVSQVRGRLVVDVPGATPGSMAYVDRALAASTRGLLVSGTFSVDAAGCVRSAPPSHGNVPLFRLYDPAGVRRFAVLRENGSCGLAEELLVQTGRQYHHTGVTLTLGETHRVVAEIRSGWPGRGTARVWVDGSLVHGSTHADVGEGPFTRLVLGNDEPAQVGRLTVDRLSLATLRGAPPAPRCPASPPERSTLPGILLAGDRFTATDLAAWSAVTRIGAGAAYVAPGRTDDTARGCFLRLRSPGGAGEGRSHPGAVVEERWGRPVAGLWFAARARVLAEGGPGGNVPVVQVLHRARPQLEVYRQNGTGELWVLATGVDGRVEYVRTSAVLGLGTWHDIRVGFDTTGRTRVLLDGAEVGGADGLPLDLRPFDRVRLGALAGDVFAVDLDDVQIHGTGGSL